MDTLNSLLFIVLPYVASAMFVAGSIYRYRQTGYKVSALSSQFLEGDNLFWGSVPFHFGMIVLFLGHLFAWLLPGPLLLWNSEPVRLIILEMTAFAVGLSVLVALVALLVRRFTNPRVKIVTTRMDVAIELLILLQVVLGCWIALGYRWGASWFASDLSPYLWSLVAFNPNVEAVGAMPLVIQLHIVGAFAILLLIPFTRLIHFLVAPFHYVARPYQVVRWYWDRRLIRDPKTAWSEARPRNN